MIPKITYSNYEVPNKKISVNEYVELLDKNYLKKISKLYGTDSLSSSDLKDILSFITHTENIFVEDINNEYILMEKQVENYLVTQKVDPNKINYIIYTKGSLVNQSDKNMPYYIQHKFGFSNAIVFSLEQECCTSLLAVNILDMLLKQDGSGKGIILTSNFFPTLESRLMGLFVVSDAVGLIEMSYEDHGFEIIYFDSTTDGSITNAQDFTNQAEKVVSVGANLILKTLYKNSLTIEDVFSIIPQNTNLSGWNAYFEKLCMAPEKLFKDNFGWLGHWGDVDFVRNITDIHQSKVQAPIDSVFLAYALGTGTSLDVLLLKNK